MLVLHEMIFYAMSNWGEKTPRSAFSVTEDKKWPIMNDSNIFTRSEGITNFNSSNTSAKFKTEK